MKSPSKRSYFIRKRECFFCKKRINQIDYKDVSLLSHYLFEIGKIKPSKRTGTCSKHQRKLAVAIKRARYLAMVAYVVK